MFNPFDTYYSTIVYFFYLFVTMCVRVLLTMPMQEEPFVFHTVLGIISLDVPLIIRKICTKLGLYNCNVCPADVNIIMVIIKKCC